MLKSKIDRQYVAHSCERVCQGDILRDFKYDYVINDDLFEFYFPYLIIISQDCDLEHQNNKEPITDENEIIKSNQFLPNILFLPAFPAETFLSGNHLEGLYKVRQDFQNPKIKDKIKKNELERFYYLESYPDLQIPELILDFKIYHTLDTRIISSSFSKYYRGTLNELFRERLSQRFANYINRFALPELTAKD